MKNLYRRYRPLKLADVIGQEQVTEPLQKTLASGKIGHAYLFIGPRGCGKTSVARILAHEINGFKYELEDNYVDIIEIDGASNRGIDDIRELREKAAISPTAGKYKVYIVDEVHMLTPQAFNALLKTLEEPPAHVVFILATTDAHKVPITISSRTQVYTFKLSTREKMAKYLKQIAEKENLQIDDDALEVIANRGGGSFRDSLSLLDQISTLSSDKITKEMVIKAMGLPTDDHISNLISSYKAGDLAKITETLKELYLMGIKPETLVEEIIQGIINTPEPILLPLLAELTDIKAPFIEARLLVAFTANLSAPTSSTTVTQRTVSTKQVTAPTRSAPPKPASGPEQTQAPATTTNPVAASPQQAASTFDWQKFLDQVRELNDAIYSQITKCDHDLTGDTLNLYPKKKIVKNILSRDNNRKVMSSVAPGIKILVHEIDETMKDAEKDATIDKLSDIMGGRVQNLSGGNPFE